MSYITPVVDRSAVDIANETAKAFINVVDWNRIYFNSQYVHDYLAGLIGMTVPFVAISTPTRTTIPTVANLNQMLANINVIASMTGLPTTTISSVFIPCTWLYGFESTPPDYFDVNLWEKNLDILLSLIKTSASYWIHCGSGNCGQVRFYQAKFGRPA